MKDLEFYKLLGFIVVYIVFVVVGSIGMGLFVVIFFNCEFCFRRMVWLFIILLYVILFIFFIFVWKYMFNNGYGVINFMIVDVFYLFKEVLFWFDNLVFSFFLVIFFVIWCYFLYVFILFLVIL